MKKLLFLTGFLLCSITIFGQSITPIPAGQTWTQARTRINANDNIASDSIAYLKAATDQNYGFIESLNDSIAAHLGKINLRAPIASPTFTGTVSGITKGMVGLGNVDNESKATMFTSPVFTGTVPRLGSPVTDTLATRAYARQFGGGDPDSTVFATVNYVDTQIGQVEAGEFDTTSIYERLNDTTSLQAGYGIDLVEGTGTLTIGVDTTNEIASRAYAASVGGGAYDSTYIHYRVDSLATLVTNLRDSIAILTTEVESIWDALANLGTDLVGPRFDSAWIRSDTLWVTYQIPDVQTDSVPAIANFNLTEGSTSFGIDSIWFANDSIMVAKLDSVGLYGATYLLDYTRTNAYPQLQDTLGNLALSWSDKAVTNNMAEPAAGEMISNGDFSGGSTDWVTTGGWTITGGAAVFDDVTTGQLDQLQADMASPLEANTAYTLTFSVSGTTGGGIYMTIRCATESGTITLVAFAEYNSGNKSVQFTTPADISDGGIRFVATTDGDSGATIDNISLTED